MHVFVTLNWSHRRDQAPSQNLPAGVRHNLDDIELEGTGGDGPSGISWVVCEPHAPGPMLPEVRCAATNKLGTENRIARRRIARAVTT